MAYRIRYEVRRRDHRWLALVAAGLFCAVLTKEHWYWELARHVGEQIYGAG